MYGLGHDGIPSDTMINALKPQATVQKPEKGWQHPNGDALEVADSFFRNGGKQLQIYLQDWFDTWPYPTSPRDNNCEGYKNIVKSLIPNIKATRERCKQKYGDDIEFVYVLFNEPDWIWFELWRDPNIPVGRTQLNNFLNAWKTMYDMVLQEDPEALIIGPNFCVYREKIMEEFVKFCVVNNCYPHIISWHELDASFYTNWYSRYNHYRELERKYGVQERLININEYVPYSIKIDNKEQYLLGIPGELIQYIARFENCKVDGCLAFWTRSGCLNDLVTETNNKAAGGWWLFKWYGDMTGHHCKSNTSRFKQ